MTTLGGAGTYTISQLSTTLGGCPGKLTIPSGYTLDLNTNTTFPSGIKELEVLNGGVLNVNFDYNFPNSLEKISLLDNDMGGINPSGRINFQGNQILNLASGTNLYIQNTVTLSGTLGAALTGSCSQQVLLYIGGQPYAGCQNANGGGVCYGFGDVIVNGGTPQIDGNITIDGAIVSGNQVCYDPDGFNLKAAFVYSGTFTSPPTMTWTQLTGSPVSIGSDLNIDPKISVVHISGAVPGTYSFRLTAVQDLSISGCSLSNTSVTITKDYPLVVVSSPSATISVSPAMVCQNTTSPIVTIHNAEKSSITVSYDINGANTASVTINPSSNATISVPTNIGGTFTYNLVSVSYLSGAQCINNGVGSATVTISPLPVAPTSAQVDRNNFCMNDNGQITLTALGGSGATLTWHTGSCTGPVIGTNTLTIDSPTTTTTYYANWSTDCGISTCASVIVTVADNQQPVITCPVATNANRNANASVCTYTVSGTEFDATATDNCGVTALTYSLSGVTTGTGTTLAGKVFNKGVTTVTWTATDGVTTAVTCSFTVTVVDNQQPVITCPVATNADRNANASVCTYTVSGTEFDATATDNCGVTALTYSLSGVTTGTGTTLAGKVFNKGVTTVTWTATDGVTTAVTCSFTVTVVDNQQPVITCPVATNANRNANASVCTYTVSGTEFDATATDNCGVTALTYSLSGVTTGTGTTLAGKVFNKGVTTVTWTATDGVTTAVTCSFTVTVVDNQQPVITCPVATNANRNANASVCTYTVSGTEFDATATDNCGVTALTYSLSGVTTGTGTTLAGKVFNKGVTTVTWTATDGVTTAVTCSFTVTVVDNQQPVITCPVATNANRNANASVCTYTVSGTEFDATATDNCGVTALTYSLSGVTTGTGTTLAGKVFNKGVTTVTWTATDGVTTAVTCSFTVTVVDNQQPVITCPVATNANRNANASVCTYTVSGTEFDATATDNCGVTALTYSLSGVTTGTGTTLAGKVFNKGVTTVTWTATDGVTTAVTCSFTVTVVDNQQPVITCPVATNADRNANASVCTYTVSGTEFDATATDNCGVTALTYSLSGVTTGTGTTLAGKVFNKGVTTVTWTATDGVTTAVTCSFTVTVVDNQQPVITCPVATNANRNANASVCTYTVSGTEFDATATDNCGVTALTYSLSGVTTGTGTTLAGKVFNKGVTTVTWTATDGVTTAVTCSFTVTVHDTELPTFTRPSNIIIYTDSGCNYDASTAITGDVTNETDNCSSGLQATYVDVVNSGICPGSKVISRTWSLIDNENNAAADQVQTITILDNTAPTFTRPADITIYKDANCANPAALSSTGDVTDEHDNCSTGLEATYVDADITPAGSCEGKKVIQRTWSLVDKCGNAAANQVQTITIEDNTAPTFTRPDDITIYKDANCANPAALSSTGDVTDEHDNCSNGLEATYVDADITPAGSCEGKKVIQRTWSLVDKCGNAAANQVQTITIEDNLAPIITGTIPLTIVQGCTINDAPPAASNVAALESLGLSISDNCTPDVAMSVTSSYTYEGKCPIIITRIYTVTDACGNSTTATATQIIKVDDKIPPTITGSIAVSNIEGCSTANAPVAETTLAGLNALGLIISDGCTPNDMLTISSSDASSGVCPIVLLRTYGISDACGNTSSYTQTINIKDTTAPEISSIPANVTVSCVSEVPTSNTGLVVATDNCGGTVSVTVSSDVITNKTCDNRYTITRVYTATDICGNSSSMTQTILVDDQTAPEISSIPENVTVSCASEVPASNTGLVVVTDNCGGAISVTVSPDVVTNKTCDNRYTISRKYTATDVCGNSSEMIQIILVDDQTAPEISSIPANVTVSCSSEIPASNTSLVVATDNCQGALTVAVLPDVISDQTCDNRYTITRKYTVTDVCGNLSSMTQTILVDDQIAPVISSIPANQVVSCASDVLAANTALVTATDNCNGTVSITVASDVITNKTCDNRFTITRIYTATDICGNSSSMTQTIMVDDQTAPEISFIPADITVSCASEVPAANTASVTATDNCDGTVSITVSSDVITNKTCDNRYIITRIYTATDVCGNSTSQTQTITVDDQTAPVILGSIPVSTVQGCSVASAPAAVTTVAALESLGLTISDGCTPVALLSVTSTDTSSGVCPIVVSRTYSIADICGNVSTYTQKINVVDNTAPVVTGTILDSTVEGCDLFSVPAPVNTVSALESIGLTISDNCSADGSLIVSSSDVSSGSCPLVVVRTYRIADICGNFTLARQTINVFDRTAPIVSGSFNALSVEGCSEGDAPAAVNNVSALESMGISISDACTNDANLVVTSTQSSSGTCPIIITRIYTITDACGNFVTATQVIHVDDNTPPVVKTKNITLPLNSDGTVLLSAAEIDGGSTDNCSIKSMIVSKTSFNCTEIGANLVSLTVTDNCGNVSTSTAVVTITDPTPPSLSVNDVEFIESSGKAAVTVSLANARACDVSFAVTTANGTALEPDDYTAVSGVYTIVGGTSSVVVYIPLIDDKIAEPSETFIVKLSNAVNSVIADDQGTVTILDDDSPPKVIIEDASATEGNPLSFSVSLGNISSSDITLTLGFTNVTTSDNDYSTTPVIVSFPAGTISATATVSTTADPIQEANETFTLKITAATGSVGDITDTGTGTIIDDDDSPVAIDDDITTNEDVPFQGNVALNDAPNAVTGNIWSVVQAPDHGTVVMSTDGKFTYTPAANYNGTDAFSYKLCDAEGDCDEAVVSVTIIPVDDQPIANDDLINFYLDGILNGKVADNDVPSGDGSNVWTIMSQPANGTISFNQDGSFVYTPNLNFLGSDSFTYKLCDVDGDCDQATVTIVIEDVVLPNQVLTPNGDEDNETFIINGIQFYPQNNLTVYNRWGNKVYQKSGYNNEWKGESNMSKVGSSALPVGTYFFVLEYGKQRHKTGYVYLDR